MRDYIPTMAKDGYIYYPLKDGYRIKRESRKKGEIYKVHLPKVGTKQPRVSFDTLDDAKDFAQIQYTEAKQKGINVHLFTEVQKKDAVEAYTLLKDYGISLTASAAYFVKMNKKVDFSNKTGTVIDRYLKEKKQEFADGHLRERSYKECIQRLAKFKEDHDNRAIEGFTTEEINQWLNDSFNGKTHRDNHKRYLRALFNWCAEKKLITTDNNPVHWKRGERPAKKPHVIYEPAQVEKIMQTAEAFASKPVKRWMDGKQQMVLRREIVPWLALSFFGGLRSEEINRLKWQDIDLSVGEINVNEDTSKNAFFRTVDISDNLLQYLIQYRGKDEALVFPHSETSRNRWRQDVFKNADVKSEQNAGRASFATYHLALHSEEETYEQLGHTTSKTLFLWYKGKAKNRKVQAKRYFEIAPAPAEKIVQFKAG